METEVNKTKINGRPRWQERTKEQIMNSPSTSSRKMAGLFPPSSSVVLFRLLSPAAFMISCPTCQQSLSWSAVPPVNSHCHDQLCPPVNSHHNQLPYLSKCHLSWSAVPPANSHCHDQLSYLSAVLKQSLSWSTVPPDKSLSWSVVNIPTWQQSLSWSAVPPDNSHCQNQLSHLTNHCHDQLFHMSTQSIISCPTCQHSHWHDQLFHLSTVNNQLSHLPTLSLSWSAVPPVNTVTVMFSCPTCQHCHCHVQLSHLSTVNNQLSHLSTQSLTWSAVSPVNTQAWSAVPPVDLKYCYFSYTCIIFSWIVLSSIYLSTIIFFNTSGVQDCSTHLRHVSTNNTCPQSSTDLCGSGEGHLVDFWVTGQRSTSSGAVAWQHGHHTCGDTNLGETTVTGVFLIQWTIKHSTK